MRTPRMWSRAGHVRAADPRAAERGVVLIWVALTLIVLIGFGALILDVAKAVTTKTQLQNAADAAALAAASAINSTTGLLEQDEAIARAQAVAANNRAFEDGPTPVIIDATDVVFLAPQGQVSQVRVTARRDGDHPLRSYLASVLGLPSFPVRATATAQVERASKSCELLPLGAAPPANGFTPGCGTSYTLKAPGGGGTQGNYGFVDFPGCTEGPCGGMGSNGANTLRCLIANGYQCCIGVGDQIYSEPGNKSGPALQAMQDRFNADTDRRTTICYRDYTGNQARVVTVPIVTPFGNGKTLVTVTGFASFFLLDLPGSGANATIKGEFICLTTPGIGGGSGSGVGAFTVSLVH